MSRQPNIIWIFGDQHRAQSLSIAGDPNLCTPNIDRLGIEGLWFRKGAIANNPWCCPARFMLLSGQYPHRGGFDRTPAPEPMDPALPTVATLLGNAGYRTAWFGKWHLDGKAKANEQTPGTPHVVPRPRRGGFDTWVGYENNNSQYDCPVHGHIAGQDDEIAPYRLPGYESNALTDLFLDELDRRRDDDAPFFAALSVQPPHGPCLAPAEDMARHNPARVELRRNVPPVPWVEEIARRELAGYHAQIENLDHQVGRILQRLTDNGQLDDTMIVFFSDHGDCMGSHGYREKSSPWEESIRVPFLIGGGVPYRGRRFGPVDAPVSLIDVLPTTLGIAGVDRPDGIDGYDWSGYLANGTDVPLTDDPDSVYIQHTVRKQLKDGLDRPWRGVVTADGWKYVCLPNAPFCLFNLNDDPYELANLAFNTRFMDQRKRLHGRLEQWLHTADDSFVLPEI